jgi:hypothetical protein
VNNLSNSIKCRSHETVARRIDGQILEATGDHPSCKKLATFGGQEFYVAPNPAQYCVAVAIAEAQIPHEPTFHRANQEFRDEVWDIVRVLLHGDFAAAKRTKEIRGIEHQQPEIPNGDTPDVAALRLDMRLDCRCHCTSHQNPSIKHF